MYRKSIILSSTALLGMTFGLLAEPPATIPAEPTAPAQPSGDPQAVASAAVQKDIIQVLQAQNDSSKSSIKSFSRVGPPPSFSYTFTMVNTAPDNVSFSPEKIPFEVRRARESAAKVANAPAAFLAGYYDTTSKSLKLYDTNAKAYVSAAEHPFMKIRGR